MPVSRARLREIAARSRVLMTHAERLAECKKRRPSFVIKKEAGMLTARWTEHDGPAKQTIARVVLAEEMLVRLCYILIVTEDEERARKQ